MRNRLRLVAGDERAFDSRPLGEWELLAAHDSGLEVRHVRSNVPGRALSVCHDSNCNFSSMANDLQITVV